jgi:Tol biopolymer transport system component
MAIKWLASLVLPERFALVVVGIDGAAPRTLKTFDPFEGGQRLRALAWSPDGQQIVVSIGRSLPRSGIRDEGRLVSFSVKDGAEQRLGREAWSVDKMAWLPDGSGLIVSADPDDNRYQLWFVSWPDGVGRRITNDTNNYRNMTASADSKSITATTRGATRVNLWTAPANDVMAATRVPGDPGGGSDFVPAPNGSVLFTRSGGVWSLALDGSAPRRLTPAGIEARVGAVAAKADVVVLRVSPVGGGPPSMWRIDLNGGGLAEIPGGANKAVVSVSPDGQTVFFRNPAARGPWPRRARDGGTRAGSADPGARVVENASRGRRGRSGGGHPDPGVPLSRRSVLPAIAGRWFRPGRTGPSGRRAGRG